MDVNEYRRVVNVLSIYVSSSEHHNSDTRSHPSEEEIRTYKIAALKRVNKDVKYKQALKRVNKDDELTCFPPVCPC